MLKLAIIVEFYGKSCLKANTWPGSQTTMKWVEWEKVFNGSPKINSSVQWRVRWVHQVLSLLFKYRGAPYKYDQGKQLPLAGTLTAVFHSLFSELYLEILPLQTITSQHPLSSRPPFLLYLLSGSCLLSC